jgi:hypothetical protein
VTVIVDFTHFGRTLERGCAPGSPANALVAMHAAGFGTAGTTRYGDAFLCRIDNLPAPKDEACGDTPPANASWSFYWAKPGDTAWTYSRTGVLSNHPGAGSIIAFAFGNYAKPGIRPAAALPPPPPASSTTRVVTDPTAPTSPPVTALVAPTTVLPVTTAPTAASTPSARTTTTRATTSATSPLTTSTLPRIVDRAATGSISHHDSGSPLPALLAAALVVILAAGAALTIRARRRRPA